MKGHFTEHIRRVIDDLMFLFEKSCQFACTLIRFVNSYLFDLK